MKKTVGDLIYGQAIEQGFKPDFVDGFISPVQKTIETFLKLKEEMREPIEMVNSVAESMKPHMEAMSKIATYELPQLPSIFISPDESDFVFTRPVQEVRITNPEDIAQVSTKRISEFVIASYLLPKNANWESLDIKFIDGHFVQVSYPNMKSKKFDFKDMGFINMKTVKPDTKWQLLKAIAENDGALTNSKWNKKYGRNIKYELNEGLKKFFGMSTNPIPHYTKKNGYSPLFSIRKE